jgi:hypothetical protein
MDTAQMCTARCGCSAGYVLYRALVKTALYSTRLAYVATQVHDEMGCMNFESELVKLCGFFCGIVFPMTMWVVEILRVQWNLSNPDTIGTQF